MDQVWTGATLFGVSVTIIVYSLSGDEPAARVTGIVFGLAVGILTLPGVGLIQL